jgi:ABC-type maltose transport system permease subunit
MTSFGSPDEDIMAYIGGASGASLFSHYLDTINNQAGNWSSQDGCRRSVFGQYFS